MRKDLQSTLNALSEKYRIRRVKSLSEFVTEYYRSDRLGVILTPLEKLEHYIRINDRSGLEGLRISLTKNEAEELIKLTDSPIFLAFILSNSPAAEIVTESSKPSLLYAAADLGIQSSKLFSIAEERKDYILRNKLIKKDLSNMFAKPNWKLIEYINRDMLSWLNDVQEGDLNNWLNSLVFSPDWVVGNLATLKYISDTKGSSKAKKLINDYMIWFNQNS